MWCSSFYVKEFDVIVHKIISLYNPINFLAILYATSLANLVVEVGTRHSHQTLLSCGQFKKKIRRILIKKIVIYQIIKGCQSHGHHSISHHWQFHNNLFCLTSKKNKSSASLVLLVMGGFPHREPVEWNFDVSISRHRHHQLTCFLFTWHQHFSYG